MMSEKSVETTIIQRWWPVVAALFIGAGGASSFFVTRGEADATTRAAVAEAQLAAAIEARDRCTAILTKMTGGTP